MLTNRTTRSMAVGAVLSVVFPIAASTAAASADSAAGHRPARRTVVSLLAGSHTYLAYALGYESGKNELVNTKSEYLWVRSKSGQPRDLGPAPKRLESSTMSIVGSTLYGVTGDDPNHPTPEVAHWWNLRSHAKGHAKLPSRFSFVTGAPHGFVVTKGNQLFEQSRGGKRTTIGIPMPSASFIDAVAGPKGLVVFAHTDDANSDELMSYMRWNRPGHYRKLQAGTTQWLLCTSVSQAAVGCEGGGDSDESPPPVFALIPLSGAAAMTRGGGADGQPPRNPVYTGGNVALAGRMLIWQANRALVSMSAAHPKPQTGPRSLRNNQYAYETIGYDPYSSLHLPFPAVSALGGVAVLNLHHSRVVLAHTATATKKLFALPATDH